MVLHGRDEARLRALHGEILKKEKADCPMVAGDLGTPAGVRAVQAALGAHGVGVLVNNAAVNPELASGVSATEIEDVRAVLDVNTAAPIALSYAARAHFKAAGGGTIVNVNTVAGLRGSSREVMYAVSKFGLRGFSESVKEDWLKEGIKIIDVFSGALGTGMSAHRADREQLIAPQELAEFLVGLCATKSFFVKELNVRRTAV